MKPNPKYEIGAPQAISKNAFELADELRSNALDNLLSAEEFYIEFLKKFPEQCDYDLSHERGIVEAMGWQARQLRSLTTLYYSNAGQDCFLDSQIFKGKRNGVFVEVGGYDGVAGSNCLFFEAIRNWTGIMVEPSPSQMAHANLFRQCKCINAAISTSDGQGEFINITSGDTRMSGLADGYPVEKLNEFRNREDHQEEKIIVPLKKLETLLAQENLKKVDYCSLNVGGAEFPILSEFPHEIYEVNVWSVKNSARNQEIAKFMISKGYNFLTVLGDDEIYQKNAI